MDLAEYPADIVSVDIFVAILARRELEDAHVRYGEPVGGSFDGNTDELEVRNKGKTSDPP
jgi:hypothetical protein